MIQINNAFAAGIGNGMLIISSSVILQQYFDKRRTLATALATTGFGISPLVVAPLTRLMSERLGWRLAILILGCVYMQGAVIGSLLRPVPGATAMMAARKAKSVDEPRGSAIKYSTNLNGQPNERCNYYILTYRFSQYRLSCGKLSSFRSLNKCHFTHSINYFIVRRGNDVC